MIGRLFVSLALASLAPAVARADAPGATPASPPGYQWQLVPVAQPDDTRWYRGTMVIADLASVGVFFASEHYAGSSSYGAYAIPAAISFAALGPVIHVLHGDHAGAGKSLALRVGLPLAGVAIAWVGFRCQGSTCYDGNNDDAYELFGGLIGAATAAVVDDGWLAHEPRREAATFTPVILPTPGGGAAFGLTGRF